MDLEEKTSQLEEVTIDKVCRTCLSTSDELAVTLFDVDEDEKTFIEMITICFGKIVPSLQTLPTRLCNDCKELIRKSFDFRSRCIKSTEILIGSFEDSKISIAESKETQTDEDQEVIQFDNDANFEGIQLHEEDAIFVTPETALIDIQRNTTTLDMKSEGEALEIEALDEHFVEQMDVEELKTEDDIEVSQQLFETTDCQVQNDEEEEEVEEDEEEEEEEGGEEEKKFHKCDKCIKAFSRPSLLRRHMLLSHDVTRTIKCLKCEKKFSREDQLDQHMLVIHYPCSSKPYHCEVPECSNKGFFKREQLMKHMEAKHSEKNPDHKEICTICLKTFTSKKNLRSHMKGHSNEKIITKKDPLHERPYLCSECGLRFVRNDYLVIHMRRHLGLKPYKCRFCDKGFPRATDLTVHERYHTNEKTHLCNLCGKGFQRAYNLLVHMRVHTGEKPYECNYCSKSFSQGNDLKAHIRRHTGERFKCDLCSEGFIQGYHLTHHKRTVHGLDVKSHIRRVEKFSTTLLSENAQNSGDQEHDQSIKIEDEYSQVAINAVSS